MVQLFRLLVALSVNQLVAHLFNKLVAHSQLVNHLDGGSISRPKSTSGSLSDSVIQSASGSLRQSVGGSLIQ